MTSQATLPLSILCFSDSHGTQCASIIAAEANNRRCGVGVAYEVTLGGEQYLFINMHCLKYTYELYVFVFVFLFLALFSY